MARPPSQPFASDLAGEPEELLALVHDRHDRHRLRGYLGYLSHHRTAPPLAMPQTPIWMAT